MKKIIGIIAIVAIIAVVVVRLIANYEKINKAKPNSGISSIVNVNVVQVEELVNEGNLNLTGTIYPVSELNISAQAQGQITSLNVELGQYKTKGDVIATIDNKLKILDVKNAALNEAKLKLELERTQNLFTGGSSTQQQLDDARNAYESSKIQLEQAEKQLADASVVSPLNGVVTQKLVEEGAYSNPGSSIATIIDISKLKIKINASEANAYQLNIGDPVAVTTEIYPNIKFAGKITFISDKGDESHNYPVEVEIPNNKQNPLKAGTFVNVQIKTAGTKGLFIPREALIGSTQDASVFVAENGKATMRKIIVQNNTGAYLQVLSGLTIGETVIVTGQINLVDGKSINVVEN